VTTSRGRGRGREQGRERGSPRERERGTVTAELALALPAVTLLLAAVLVLGSAGVGQLRCADAARAGARAAALGEPSARIVGIVQQVAGGGATVAVDRADAGGAAGAEWVRVTVTRAVGAGPFARAPLRASASAVARVEPGGLEQ